MFTLLVSWLAVACVPGLLMLATLGLERLERALDHHAAPTANPAEFSAQTEPIDIHTLAREGLPEALDYLHRRQAQRANDIPRPRSQPDGHRTEPFFATSFGDVNDASLSMQISPRSWSTSQVAATRHTHRV